MPKSIDSIVSFSAGEVSPKLDARVDQPKYKQAMRQCRNGIPYKTGGWTRRPGLEFIAPVKDTHVNPMDDASVVVLAFQFSPDTTFILEVGNFYIRFFSNGQQVIVNSAPLWVSGSTYVEGDFAEDPVNLQIYYCVSSITGGTQRPGISSSWRLQATYEVPTPYNAVTVPGQDPWDADIWQLTICQINDVIYFVHPAYPPYSLTRFGDTDWVMQQVNFLSPALLDQNATNTTIAAGATTGNGVPLVATAPAWQTAFYYSIGNSVLQGSDLYNCVVAHVSGTFATDLAAGFWVLSVIFNGQHIGSTWQLAYLRPSATLEVDGTAAGGFTNGTSASIQALGKWEVHTYGVWSADIAIQRSVDGGQVWDTIRSITGRSDRNVDITGIAVQLGLYRIVISNNSAPINPGATNPRVVFECVDSFLYGLVKIASVTDSRHATGNIVTQLASTAATEYWSEAAWSNYRGFPQAITSFQQRVIYGSSGYEPQKIWGTVTNDIENFALGDQTLSTDAFAFSLNAPSRGPIQWLIAQTDLFAGFSGAEWVINSGSTNAQGLSSGAAITATNVNAVEHSSWGSAASVQPCVAGDAVLFTQRQATSIRQMVFSVYTEKYMSTDLTGLADNLFSAGIVQMAYQARWRKQSIIWVVTKQGILVGMTYEMDQQIYGWHVHETGYGQFTPDGTPITPDNGFESVAVIDGKGQDDDEVWVVVNRLIGGVKKRFIERFDPNNWEETFVGAPLPPAPVLADAYYVDCGIVVLAPGSRVISGLAYLEGRYVVGLADGNAFGPLLVGSGVITLPDAIPTTVAKVIVGLPVRYTGQPMRFDMDPRGGNTQALYKQLSDVFIRVWNAVGGSISNGVKAVPIPYTKATNDPFAVPNLVVEPTDIRITPFLNPIIDADPQVIITGNDALPLTVLALIYKYEITSVP